MLAQTNMYLLWYMYFILPLFQQHLSQGAALKEPALMRSVAPPIHRQKNDKIVFLWANFHQWSWNTDIPEPLTLCGMKGQLAHNV